MNTLVIKIMANIMSKYCQVANSVLLQFRSAPLIYRLLEVRVRPPG